MLKARRNCNTAKTGFTIVELLIVIIVIAILAAVTVVAYNGVRSRAQLSRLASEVSGVSRRMEMYKVEFNTYPVTINDCPTPATSSSICLTTPSDETYSYRTDSKGNMSIMSGYTINNLTPSYDLFIYGTSFGTYVSSAERMPLSGEFLQYVDLAPIIDMYGLRKYKLSFDVKSADITAKSTVYVYFQNGSTARYGGLAQNVNVSTSYAHYDLEFTAVMNNSAVAPSILAFYGTYGTGNIPTVQNVKLTIAQ